MKNNLNKNNGYAILFTVVIVSIITLITIGVSSTANKQLVLSSLSKDSQIAFYQADVASDCALYLEVTYDLEKDVLPAKILCGLDSSGNDYYLDLNLLEQSEGRVSLEFNPTSEFINSNKPCFSITLNKNFTETVVRANGYNICNKNSPRSVERTIEVKY